MARKSTTRKVSRARRNSKKILTTRLVAFMTSLSLLLAVPPTTRYSFAEEKGDDAPSGIIDPSDSEMRVSYNWNWPSEVAVVDGEAPEQVEEADDGSLVLASHDSQGGYKLIGWETSRELVSEDGSLPARKYMFVPASTVLYELEAIVDKYWLSSYDDYLAFAASGHDLDEESAAVHPELHEGDAVDFSEFVSDGALELSAVWALEEQEAGAEGSSPDASMTPTSEKQPREELPAEAVEDEDPVPDSPEARGDKKTKRGHAEDAATDILQEAEEVFEGEVPKPDSEEVAGQDGETEIETKTESDAAFPDGQISQLDVAYVEIPELSVLNRLALATPMLSSVGNGTSEEGDGEPSGEDGPIVDNFGIGDISTKWVVTDASGKSTTTSDPLLLSPTNNGTFSVVMQLEVAMTSGDPNRAYDPGQISVRFPAALFTDRNGNPIGNVKLSVPEISSAMGRLAYKMETIDGVDYYTITNVHQLVSAAQLSIQIAVDGLVPSQIEDMSDFSIYMEVDAVAPDGRAQHKDTQASPIHAIVDTYETLEAPSKTGFVYEGVPSGMPASLLQNLPGGPASAGDYIFVRWNTAAGHHGNQPYTMSVRDEVLPYAPNHYGAILLNPDGADASVYETCP